jgi:glycosyltransferase involved in cell wall biosynthesis
LNVLFVSPFPLGGTYRFSGIGNGLSKLGHNVSMLVIPPEFSTIYRTIEQSVDSIGEVKVFYWPTYKFRTFGYRRVRRFSTLANLVRKNDIAHLSKTLSFPGRMTYLCATLFRKHLVVDFDDWDGIGGFGSHPQFSFKERMWTTFLEEYIARKASAVTVISEVLRRRVLDMGVEENRVFFAGTGADTKFFDPATDGTSIRTKYGIGSDPLVVYMGSLLLSGVAWRQLIDTMFHLCKFIPKAKMLIVSPGGPALPHMKRYIAELNLGGSIILATEGHPRQEIPKFLAAADVLLNILSREYPDVLINMARSNTKMFEYASMKKPMVLTDIGECRNCFEGAAMLVKSDDPRDYAEAIMKLIEDKNLARSLAEEARARMIERYDWNVIAKKVDKAYQYLKAK